MVARMALPPRPAVGRLPATRGASVPRPWIACSGGKGSPFWLRAGLPSLTTSL